MRGQSYWSKSSAIWKMSQKHLVLLQLLPTTLRGFVPQMHESTCRLAEGLRLLDGQVHSRNRALELCLDPRSRAGNYDRHTNLAYSSPHSPRLLIATLTSPPHRHTHLASSSPHSPRLRLLFPRLLISSLTSPPPPHPLAQVIMITILTSPPHRHTHLASSSPHSPRLLIAHRHAHLASSSPRSPRLLLLIPSLK